MRVEMTVVLLQICVSRRWIRSDRNAYSNSWPTSLVSIAQAEARMVRDTHATDGFATGKNL